MDIEPNSQESRSSRMHSERRSSYFSLGRTSSHRLSVSNRLSVMKQTVGGFSAMDLEYYRPREDRESLNNPKRTSQFFQRSEDDKHPPTKRDEKSNLTRKSNFRINHQCVCQSYKNDCAGWHCICFLSPREICVVGQCCKGCIESKNLYLQNVCGYTLARDKVPQPKPDDSFQRLLLQKKSSNIHYLKQVHMKGGGGAVTCCTCKKSHCQKKYCLCFESGKFCQEYCECEDCTNKEARGSQNKSEKERKWERYGTFNPVEGVKLDTDFIDQFIQPDFLHAKIHAEMEFEPVNFEAVLSNMYM